MTECKRITILAAVLAAVMLCACLLPALIPFAQKIIDNSSENFGGGYCRQPESRCAAEGRLYPLRRLPGRAPAVAGHSI